MATTWYILLVLMSSIIITSGENHNMGGLNFTCHYDETNVRVSRFKKTFTYWNTPWLIYFFLTMLLNALAAVSNNYEASRQKKITLIDLHGIVFNIFDFVVNTRFSI